MKGFVKLIFGDKLFEWLASNLVLLSYVFLLTTFIVINSYSGVRKCREISQLEKENKSLRWEYLQLKADFTKAQSRKEVVPEDYSDHVVIPIIIE